MVATQTCFTVFGLFKLSRHTISAPVMPKFERNRSALHHVLAQGASNRAITVTAYETRGLFHWRFFARDSSSMETSPWHNSVAGHQIATNLCTCHDSTAVVPCTKFCNDHCIRIKMRVKWNFHRIWIAMEKPLVNRVPEHQQACLWLSLHSVLY